ncbi:DUF3105 domain-containing protein [Paenibacillus sp.]|uniref:DUF3105 domain-containing protein n=1 Tax=Paenibacillus sp. TaxID=58172 RepID=UPI002D3BB8EF|nr:DUF3105 domain-containing protein [Paenibacillus sp.]HZG88392.1 DUF3105 domain-containing protein [Paenibacillus sp.]
MKSNEKKPKQLSKREREAKKAKTIWISIGIAAAAVIALFIILSIQQNREQARLLQGEETFADAGHEHIADVAEFDPSNYNSDPPTSGPHMGNVAPKGFYEETIHDAYLVHNLEDGFVVLYYRPDLAAEKLDAIRSFAEKHNRGAGHSGVVAVPREGIAEEAILTAWTKMLRLPSYDDAKASAFVSVYVGIDHHQ